MIIAFQVHRRSVHGGVKNEPLNETGQFGDGLIARGSHYVFVSPTTSSARLHRDFAERLFMAPAIAIVNDTNEEDWRKNYNINVRIHIRYFETKIYFFIGGHLFTMVKWIGAY